MTDEPTKGITRRTALVAGVAGSAAIACATVAAFPPGSKSEKGSTAMNSSRMPVVFLPHGGGPWPFVDLGMGNKQELDTLAMYLRSLRDLRGPQTAKPTAVLVISAHWEESQPTVMSGEAPPMLYDYYGFPKESYEIQWPAPGSPVLAARVRELLEKAGFTTGEDKQRGYDHGTFVPLKLTYPDADVPVVQLSLKKGLDPKEHLAMGRALAPLRDEGVFIVGSGMTFHNMRSFRDPRAVPVAEAFDAWLRESAVLPAAERDQKLTDWAKAPSARSAHPREEHLLPLMVIAGAAGEDRGALAYNGTVMSMRISAFHFG